MAEEQNQQQTSAQQAQTGQQGSAPDYTALFDKLDAILDKRSDGIARSALKDNGIAEDEAREIVTAYRQQTADQETQMRSWFGLSPKKGLSKLWQTGPAFILVMRISSRPVRHRCGQGQLYHYQGHGELFCLLRQRRGEVDPL